ncbi:hypothetical protein MMIC_P1272 [Mariprofundus micogutta]|uniref:Glycosyltransferase RgtA/B/C/D-like domain-containing protein n=1 Tax=Mariprofundus micogutta TaxID=1921010 RepID=A0A1L8CN26_9PROT|nr:glycosyltransferase family 39 protein [Mariprofundus micogutta]GAV20307.1 hypothetical protein MMIC_P1272 [Mariprofundus micogutta]
MTTQSLKTLTFLAAIVLFLPLPIMQYVAEESYYALGSYEIFVDKHWWHQSVFGLAWPKTALYNWLIIGVAQLIGWQHLEIATRIVSVSASLGSAAVVFFMARRMFPKQVNAPWLGALIYLTMGEISFWYGWLGYADATFGFFIFAAISSLWIAIEERQVKWLLISLLLISLAFLTKNISCYVMYISAGLVLLWRYRSWDLLLKPFFVLPVLISFTLPWIYQNLILDGGANTSIAIGDAMRNFLGYELLKYVSHWLSYPLLFLGRAFPVTLILIWLYLKDKQRFVMSSELVTILYILLICLLPFWLSAAGTPRYLIPFYGLLALVLTGLTLQLNFKRSALVLKIIAIVILIKVPYSFAALPYIKDWRPERDIQAVVEDIMQITDGKTLRTMNDVSTGLSIGCYINVRTPHDQYLRWYDGKERRVYVLSEMEDPKLGKLVKHWRLQGHHTYLYWQP